MDNVNSPKHYNRGGIETIEYLESTLGHQGFVDYCLGNVLKYVSRWRSKGGVEDLKKAAWYLNRSINTIHNAKSPTKAHQEMVEDYWKSIHANAS